MEIPSLHAKINDAVSKLNPRQREAVDCAAGPTLIIAGAGTGKTKTLTCKIAKLIAGGTPASRILAVTFTNKAAGEMRERVEALVPGQGSRVWIYTFHSFCVRLLRQHARAQHDNGKQLAFHSCGIFCKFPAGVFDVQAVHMFMGGKAALAAVS